MANISFNQHCHGQPHPEKSVNSFHATVLFLYSLERVRATGIEQWYEISQCLFLEKRNIQIK